MEIRKIAENIVKTAQIYVRDIKDKNVVQVGRINVRGDDASIIILAALRDWKDGNISASITSNTVVDGDSTGAVIFYKTFKNEASIEEITDILRNKLKAFKMIKEI